MFNLNLNGKTFGVNSLLLWFCFGIFGFLVTIGLIIYGIYFLFQHIVII